MARDWRCDVPNNLVYRRVPAAAHQAMHAGAAEQIGTRAVGA